MSTFSERQTGRTHRSSGAWAVGICKAWTRQAASSGCFDVFLDISWLLDHTSEYRPSSKCRICWCFCWPPDMPTSEGICSPKPSHSELPPWNAIGASSSESRKSRVELGDGSMSLDFLQTLGPWYFRETKLSSHGFDMLWRVFEGSPLHPVETSEGCGKKSKLTKLPGFANVWS